MSSQFYKNNILPWGCWGGGGGGVQGAEIRRKIRDDFFVLSDHHSLLLPLLIHS